MVVGLGRFKTHFADYSDHYILIGGAACSIAMEQAGLGFRSTKDLDIVLTIEVLNADFGKVFWDFIEIGGYQNLQKSTGKAVFYRFYEPRNKDYPAMIELFSRKPDLLPERDGAKLTPIPVGEAVASLSAILLYEGYYEFIHSRKMVFEGISMAGPDCLIPLKAKAYLDLTELARQGKKIDSKDIKKHRNDVFRLARIIPPDIKVDLTDAIRNDMRNFTGSVAQEKVDVRAILEGSAATQDDIINRIRQVYSL